MKITDMDVPAPMQTLFARVITGKKINSSTVNHATNRRGAKVKPAKKKRQTPPNDLLEALKHLALILGFIPNTPESNSFIRAQQRDIKAGNWNEAYWWPCEILDTHILTTFPTNAHDPAPPAYDYRDPSNLPSLVTYGDAVGNDSTMNYSGHTVSGYFTDNHLSWCRWVYRLGEIKNGALLNFTFMSLAGDISIHTTNRASKPMLSLIMSAALVEETSATLNTMACPATGMPVSSPSQIRGSQSLYWRYKIPATTAPYFNLVKLRPTMRNITRFANIDDSGQVTRAVICIAPRPMFGRGYNNNTAVDTSFTGTPDLYQMLDTFAGYIRLTTYLNFANGMAKFQSVTGAKTLNGATGNNTLETPAPAIYWNKAYIVTAGLKIITMDFTTTNTGSPSGERVQGFYLWQDIQVTAPVAKKKGWAEYTKISFDFINVSGTTSYPHTRTVIRQYTNGTKKIISQSTSMEPVGLEGDQRRMIEGYIL